MKIRVLTFGLAWTCCLFGQKPSSSKWQDACFYNPRAPFCAGRDFGGKATPPPKNGATSSSKSTTTSPSTSQPAPSAIDVGGIDWRFADPSADALAALSCATLSASPFAHSLIEELGANQGLHQADVRTIFRALSGLNHVALSVREDRIVLMATGRQPDAILRAPEAGWKAVSLPDNAVLIGHADAVDQAVQRISMDNPLGELASMAQQRPSDTEFWAAGSARLAGQEAAAAGAKRFSLRASMRDRLASETAFEFSEAPDASALWAWLSALGDTEIDGNVVHVRMSMEADETGQSFGRIAGSPLGQRLGALIQSARYLPVRDTPTTVHTKPVIYGLDDGPREVK